jgi:serralysin
VLGSTVAQRAEDFVQSIGVCTHMNFLGTSYANPALALQEMLYLGVDRARDSMVDSGAQSSLLQMAAGGIKLDLSITNGSSDLQTVLPGIITLLDQFPTQYPGSLASIEGPNEVNIQQAIWAGQSTLDPKASVAVSAQASIAAAIRTDPKLAAIPIINLSIAEGPTNWQTYLDALGNMSAFATNGNWHIYYNSGNQPASTAAAALALAKQVNPGQTVIVTETGYTRAMSQTGSDPVDATVQMDNTLNALVDLFQAGVPVTYIYQLMSDVQNPPPTDMENGFSLFNQDGTPFPIATAIHNLTSVLADKSANAQTFTSGSLNYSIGNLPTSGISMLLQKADGTFDLVIWNEAQDWNNLANTEISVPTTGVTVSLGATYSSVAVYDPTQSSSPIQRLSNVSSVTLGLTDHPLIVEVGPAPAPAPTPSANGTVVMARASAAITDTSGNEWTITSGGQVAVNGVADAITGGVIELAYVNGTIWQENSSHLWWGETQPNDSWAPTAGTSTSPLPSGPITTGAGSDTLVLSISEDAYSNGDGTSDANGDAAFTVSVDGQQLAGTFYATASHSAGASETLTFVGNWAPGARAVTVAFLNDAYAGTPSTDRNLYVNDVAYDGTDTKQSAALMSTGSQNFSVTDSTAIPPAVTGGGSDSLRIKVSEDYYLADAKFTVSVDGKQLGGTFTATTLHSSGNSQTLAFAGDFGSGQHTVSVNFRNDAWAGTPATDRNLYVNDIVYNGTDTKQSAALMGAGAKTFSVSGGTTPSVSETGDHGTLQKNLSQTGTYTVGGDTFVLGSGNAASVTTGTGASQIKFVGPSSVTLTGGAGQATVTADAGNNNFVAGAGSLDVRGGAGKDAYVFHTTSGLLTLEDFSLAKGDTLTIDKSLQGSLHEASDGTGGTMLTFGTNTTHGVDIHGAAMPSSKIVWT